VLAVVIERSSPRSYPTPDSSTTQPSPTDMSASADPFAAARVRMVETQMKNRDVTDSKVLAIMEKVPRHRFVLPQDVNRAYEDNPLPIGHGQTISQPYMVALMTQLLKIKPGDKILEVGTGSGYQAAILAELTDQVYTVEIIPDLAEAAAKRLSELGYTQVQVRNADGYYGWEEYAPYDAIIVTAAPDHIPQPLVRQLKDGGKLVIPVGPAGAMQSLWLVERHGEQVTSRQVLDVVFVPLTGQHSDLK
jgi:protein-L-isoaspartate(D-aspartate) O-methyltransferase